MKNVPDIRPSPIAGTWYEGDALLLGAQIDGFLAQARLPELSGEVVALIAPHAGYRYSGATAGYAYRSVAGQQYDLVAVLSPMHRPYPHPLLTSAHRAYATPLGTVEIDQPALAQLNTEIQRRTKLQITAVAYDQEHSLEIELPFLQRALKPGFHILPLMMREDHPQLVKGVGQALASLVQSQPAERKTLLVASTDLSHFYPEATAQTFDAVTLEQIQAFSPEGLYREADAGRAYACGLNAVAAVLWAAAELGADRVQVLRHSTSAETSGDYSSVVGYGAAVVLKST
jgi:MEMO1 family protein